MKKFNLFAVAFVAIFAQSVNANAAKTEFPRPKKSEAISNVAIGAERGAKGIIFVNASGAKAERGAKGGVEYPKVQIGAERGAKGIFFVDASGAKAERGGKCRGAYPAIMGADVAAMGIAKEAYPPMQRGAKRGVEYPQTERGNC